MSAYYNEVDPFAARWLRNLIAAGEISPGDVDERSISEVDAADLRGYSQCHFFAGIGGWSYALRLAGWPDERPVWTGSCPCQPFSDAGETRAHRDERHLWPAWFRIIDESRPPSLFGEQIGNRLGRAWLDHVLCDLEDARYSVGAADLPASGVGAPHKRQRLYFVANADAGGREVLAPSRLHEGRASGNDVDGCRPSDFWRSSDWVDCQDGSRPVEPGTFPLAHGVPARVGRLRAYGNAIVPQVAALFVTAYMDALPEFQENG